MVTNTYGITGMTCGHCVQAVTTEVSALRGVSDVRVDLEAGSVAVTSAEPLDREQLREAVAEAGYELAS